MTPFTAFYGVAGYSWLFSDKIEAGTTSLKMPTFKAPLVGFGFDTRLAAKTHLDLQYRVNFLEKEDLAGTSAKFDGYVHTVRLGINFYLNGEAPQDTGKVSP
jgi:opacity protein-like surface antigen